jgi:NhaP-type Na+/H+ or K+/H+ antiporter
MLRRLGAPNRIATVLEGESLVNDGTGLVVYAIALGAATGAGFSLPGAAGSIVVIAAGGVAAGLAVGLTSVRLRRRIDEPRTASSTSPRSRTPAGPAARTARRPAPGS